MAQVAGIATQTVLARLRAPAALSLNIGRIAMRESIELPAIVETQLIGQRVTPELAERSPGVKYPVAYVYVEKLTNSLTEKFRRYSGKAAMAVEIRVSQDRMEDLERRLQLYVEAVTGVLELSRGDLGSGLFYGGEYVVEFAPVRHGGRNYLQSAKVLFDLDVSVS
jgi:hypothetical protein